METNGPRIVGNQSPRTLPSAENDMHGSGKSLEASRFSP